jgi:prepilin-type N-terminal cleavage/methylation domain-containing protein
MKKIKNQKSKIKNSGAFTLIELLVVISIIGVLAAFIIPVAGAVKRSSYISQTKAEMGKLVSAIDGYKNAYGFYPPSSPTGDVRISQLYYELMGTSISTIAGVTYYVTLDSSAKIKTNEVLTAFPGVNGFVNCTKPGSVEDVSPAKSFLSDLSLKQHGTITNYTIYPVTLLLGAVGGPDPGYQPFGSPSLNPWRYVSPGVNNPNSYDLWMQLVIAGKTNLICNWTKQVQFNQPLP